MVMSVIMAALCAAGLVISVYFTGVFYKWFKPDVFWMPRVCRLEEKSCLMVLDTPRAKILGLPNSLLGIGFYAFFIFDVFRYPDSAGFVISTIAFLRSIYLAYSLVFVTKIPCPLCFTSHAINTVIWFFYLYRVFIS